MPRHKKLAPGLPTPRRGCLALGHQFWRLCMTLGVLLTQFWSATPGRWFWHLGVKTGRLASADGCLGAGLGAWVLFLGAWASSSAAATFPGLFQTQINCQPYTFIYQIEAPDVSFLMQLESDDLEYCS
ncbi:hypothetical protein PIB30_047510 [Stylosanthes scabra]|uniref:Uncharacterized protein n=1 Tax=Stylosanthes scabra TaxID=79078 RepID=A0ABU6WGH5_9FABA|nr:hypothetical protein [Stylosanthes scabra]